MAVDQAFVDRMIQNQHSAIRGYLLFALVIVSSGIVFLIVGPMFAPEAAKVVFQVGGGFVAALGTVPIKELISRKEKLGIFETIKGRLQACQSNQGGIDEQERKRIDDLVWQVIVKTALP
jgi:hypothetical protein